MAEQDKTAQTADTQKIEKPIIGKTLPLKDANEANVLLTALRKLNEDGVALEVSAIVITLHNRIGVIFGNKT